MGIDDEGVDLGALYRNRFDPTELAFKTQMWGVLGRDFFQRYIRTTDTVLDLGAGNCEFLAGISCGEKIAVDVAPPTDVPSDVVYHRVPATGMTPVPAASVDVVFASNFFEHVKDKGELLDVLRECRRVLRPTGSLLILQPNIRYLPGRYWDYLDHFTPLTHLSMVEALTLTGFSPRRVVPRFLPYTVKGARVPKRLFLLKVYLRLPLLWPVVGRQMFIHSVVEPPVATSWDVARNQ